MKKIIIIAQLFGQNLLTDRRGLMQVAQDLELDFAYSLPGRARFRVNMYRQRDALGAAFRLIPFEIKPLEALGVPAAVANFAMLPRGFVLVTGPTGSGKSMCYQVPALARGGQGRVVRCDCNCRQQEKGDGGGKA